MAFSPRLLRLLRPAVRLPLATYRTSQTDPLRLTEADAGLFYSLDKADFEAYLHGFFSRPHRDLMATFEDRSLLVRAPALEVTRCLAQLDPARPPARFLFYGPRGAGLTSQQAQVAHWAARSGWLLVHVHGAALESVLRYTPDLSKSASRPGRWDTPSVAVTWLKYFSEINRAWLEQRRPKITEQVVWNLNESNEPGTPWETVIQFGIARPNYATDCIGVVLREIRKQAISSLDSPNPLRALVCIDGINALWSDGSRLQDSDYKPVLAKDLSLFHFFRKLTRDDWCNAALVGSVSTKAAWRHRRESSLPRYLLGEDGWRALDPFLPVHVDHFSRTEMRRFIAYLQDMGWLTNPAVHTEMGRQELIALSDCNPKELIKIGVEW